MKILYSHDAREAVRRIRCNVDKERSELILASIRDGCEKLRMHSDLGSELVVSGGSAVRALMIGNYVILYEHDDDVVYLSAIARIASVGKDPFSEFGSLQNDRMGIRVMHAPRIRSYPPAEVSAAGAVCLHGMHMESRGRSPVLIICGASRPRLR